MQAQSADALGSVRVGPARLLDDRINPTAGVRIAAEGDALVVRYAHPHGVGAIERLDATSLVTIGQSADAVDRSYLKPSRPNRIVLDGGRFVVLWKSGDSEHGYHAMAQSFNSSDGSPRGVAVALSPSDVSGPVSAVPSGGHHLVATFAASTESGFAAYAVPLEAL